MGAVSSHSLEILIVKLQTIESIRVNKSIFASKEIQEREQFTQETSPEVHETCLGFQKMSNWTLILTPSCSPPLTHTWTTPLIITRIHYNRWRNSSFLLSFMSSFMWSSLYFMRSGLVFHKSHLWRLITQTDLDHALQHNVQLSWYIGNDFGVHCWYSVKIIDSNHF